MAKRIPPVVRPSRVQLVSFWRAEYLERRKKQRVKSERGITEPQAKRLTPLTAKLPNSHISQGAYSWRLDGDELTLTSGGTTITLLDRKLAEPDLPLDGIRWKVVTTITNADMRQGFRFSGQAWLSFDNGHVSGWTGCNDLSGSYTRNNTELSFSDITITDNPCPPDTEAFRTTVLTTLGPATTYTITRNKLILLSPSGIGLDLTAE